MPGKNKSDIAIQILTKTYVLAFNSIYKNFDSFYSTQNTFKLEQIYNLILTHALALSNH